MFVDMCVREINVLQLIKKTASVSFSGSNARKLFGGLIVLFCNRLECFFMAIHSCPSRTFACMAPNSLQERLKVGVKRTVMRAIAFYAVWLSELMMNNHTTK